MEEDTTNDISTNDRNHDVNQSGTGTSIDIGIEDIGSINRTSSYRNDQRKDHCSLEVKNDRTDGNSDGTKIDYSNNADFTHSVQRAAISEQRIFKPTTQSKRDLGFVPNMNASFNHQQINALNLPLNAVDVMNSASISRLQNPVFVPDINASLSNTNGFLQNHNATFSTGPTLQDHNAFKIAEGGGTSLYLGGNTGDHFDRGQSGIMHGSLWNVETAFNGRTRNIKIESQNRAVEGREVSSLPFAKRMRHSRQQDRITQEAQQQQQNLNSNASDQYENTSGRSYSLFVERDERNLSQYQCLARRQMEIFEASSADAANNAQGRNRPILPGQIGIRCRHCYKLPPKQRKTGSVYYPNRVCVVILVLYIQSHYFVRST